MRIHGTALWHVSRVSRQKGFRSDQPGGSAMVVPTPGGRRALGVGVAQTSHSRIEGNGLPARAGRPSPPAREGVFSSSSPLTLSGARADATSLRRLLVL